MRAINQWGLEGIARLGREGELSPSEGLDVLEGITRCGREGEGFEWLGRT